MYNVREFYCEIGIEPARPTVLNVFETQILSYCHVLKRILYATPKFCSKSEVPNA